MKFTCYNCKFFDNCPAYDDVIDGYCLLWSDKEDEI